MRLLAGRVGTQLEYADLSNECGVSVGTIKTWISILESSYILFLLNPYYENWGKRMVKSPKIYFYDTGLACSLLRLTDKDQVHDHFARGGLFENAIIVERMKADFNRGIMPELYYWRDSNQREVDLLQYRDGELYMSEIKSSSTPHMKYITALNAVAELAGVPKEHREVVYGADTTRVMSGVRFSSWAG
jgi:predicted AAA+ superfamily ATPase